MELLAAGRTRIPHPFSGWALQRATYLDLNGSRGLIADIAITSFLKRQSIFAALSTIDPTDPTPFLTRLGDPNGNFGNVVRTRQARDLIAAAFDAEHIPAGFLRALMRIGYKPLDESSLYHRFFDIFASEPESPKAHALRYCGAIQSETIRVLDALDPVLICPEVVKQIRSVGQARKANGIVRFLRSVCSTATDDVLASGVRKASGHGGLERFAQEFIRRADRFPKQPLPLQLDFLPLTSGAEFVALGRVMHNCLASKIPQALLGLASYYRTEVKVGEEPVPVVVELTPLSNGTWALESLNMPKNQRLPREVMADLVQRLKGLGVIIEANPHLHPQARDLAQFFGVFPIGEFQLLTQESEPDASSDDIDAMLDEVVAEMEQALRVA